MSDNEQLIAAFDNGRNAYTLQEKLVTEQAFVEMKAELMFKFENTGFKDDDERRDVWRKLQTVAWFDGILTEIINNGKIAEKELKGFEKFKSFFTKG